MNLLGGRLWANLQQFIEVQILYFLDHSATA
jgi:hypothetical protein